MLTPQDITEKGFNKVMLNGYDMGEVDDFLETMTDDYSALYKENAILKGKLKVLVEKVEEYRTTEDAMRMALLTAQRMGEEITAEANKTKDTMLKNVDKEIKERLGDTEKRIAEEEMRLVAASNETAKFLELSQAILRKHAEFLKKLETAHRTVKPKKGTQPASSKAEAKQQQPPRQTQMEQELPQTPPAKAPSPKASPRARTQQPPQQPPPQPQPQPVVVEVTDAEFDSIAEEIGNAVEKIALYGNDVARPHEDNSPTISAPATKAASSQVLYYDEVNPLKLYSPEDEMENTSPRPKFDFDDLKFGANFDTDD